MAGLIDGIVVGATGGSLAGIMVYVCQYVHGKLVDWREGKRIYVWLTENTSEKAGEQFRSTRAIASWNNVTQERARYLCSNHKKIFLSTGENEDMWGIHAREPKSVYEERGIQSV